MPSEEIKRREEIGWQYKRENENWKINLERKDKLSPYQSSDRETKYSLLVVNNKQCAAYKLLWILSSKEIERREKIGWQYQRENENWKINLVRGDKLSQYQSSDRETEYSLLVVNNKQCAAYKLLLHLHRGLNPDRKITDVTLQEGSLAITLEPLGPWRPAATITYNLADPVIMLRDLCGTYNVQLRSDSDVNPRSQFTEILMSNTERKLFGRPSTK